MKFQQLLLGSAAGWLMLTGCMQSQHNAQLSPDDEPYSQLAVYATVQELLRQHYMSGDEVSYESMTNGALKGMLNHLDRFSTYDTPEEYALTQRELTGEQVGIGIIVSKPDHDFVRVIAVLPETPAAQAGIRSGDEITAVNGENTDQLDMEQCQALLYGEVGSEVQLEICSRGDYDTPELHTLVRKQFHRSSVPPYAVRMPETNIGYLLIESFTERTPEEFDAALKSLLEQKPHALILDLRNNPGGLVDAAIEVASRFVDQGELIVSIEGRSEEVNEKLFSRPSKLRFHGPVAILTNAYSASAAEIVAGSLHDLDRATLVGETTYGKGTVQRIFPLPNGGAVRFSIAQYFTPSHQVIHEKGIAPDHEVIMTEEEDQLIAEQLLQQPSGANEKTTPVPVEDLQLYKALEILRARLPQ